MIDPYALHSRHQRNSSVVGFENVAAQNRRADERLAQQRSAHRNRTASTTHARVLPKTDSPEHDADPTRRIALALSVVRRTGASAVSDLFDENGSRDAARIETAADQRERGRTTQT